MAKRSMFVGMGVHKESIDISLAEEGRDVSANPTLKSEAPSTMQLDWISGEGYVCSAGSIHGRRQGLRSSPCQV